ncbi:hypothetical protein [Nostoc sp.]
MVGRYSILPLQANYTFTEFTCHQHIGRVWSSTELGIDSEVAIAIFPDIFTFTNLILD